MTDRKDDYYQPWLRDPAPTPGAHAPAPGEGLAKPKDEPPVGIDLSRYSAPETPRDPLVKPEAIKAGAANLWDRIRDGAQAFADWTIRVGDRADIPARVEAMEIPVARANLQAKTGALTARAARAARPRIGTGRTRARPGPAAMRGRRWRSATRRRKLSSEAGRGIGEVAGKTRAGVVDIAKAGSESLREGIGDAASKLRPAPREELAPPPSGLEQLLAREEAAARASEHAAPDLPLFAGDAAMVAAAKPAEATAAMVGDDRVADRSAGDQEACGHQGDVGRTVAAGERGGDGRHVNAQMDHGRGRDNCCSRWSSGSAAGWAAG